jgi:hypothetical protein
MATPNPLISFVKNEVQMAAAVLEQRHRPWSTPLPLPVQAYLVVVDDVLAASFRYGTFRREALYSDLVPRTTVLFDERNVVRVELVAGIVEAGDVGACDTPQGSHDSLGIRQPEVGNIVLGRSRLIEKDGERDAVPE